ncbi:alpha/beta hydrolase [Candidatus Desantisbacteria bacterium]|nr:alpha/beta hydrolase [Candidatus Desantisbacteria bacterium]
MNKKNLLIILILSIFLPRFIYSYEEKYTKIDGQKIFFITAGEDDKTPLLIIHGLGMSSGFWINNIDILAGKRRVYALDLPGFGHSEKNKKSYSVKSYTVLINKFLAQQKISKVILLGHSIGGAVSVLYTAAYPEQVEKLILADSEGVKNVKNDSFLNLVKIPIIGDILFIMRDRDMIRKSLQTDIFYNPHFVTELFVQEVSHGSRDAFLSLLRNSIDLTDELKKIQCQTLLIWGENDKLYPVGNAHVFNEKIKNTYLIVFSESGTCSNIEKFDAFNEAVIKFME